jgi:uncharacterized membrane protein
MLLALRVLMRTAHIVAGAAWIGGSIFYLVALLPALRAGGAEPAIGAQVAARFRRLVNVCMGVLLVTGMYLTFDRLASSVVGVAYVATLGVKIAVALALFALAVYQAQEGVRSLSRHRAPALESRARASRWRNVPRLILALGLLAFLLGALLTAIFESQG